MDKETTLNLARIALANSFFRGFKSQTYHWNVTGNMFLQIHEFFGELYEASFASVDVIAEQIRAMDVMAPSSISELSRYSYITLENSAVTCQEMLLDLLDANVKSLETLNKLFDSLGMIKEQGFADFVASEIDKIKKQNWMIQSLLKD
jgi:starvation-inducible DNA-binding protein